MHLGLCVYTPSGCIAMESLQKNRGYFLQELPKTVTNEGKSRKTVIVAKELAVFSARITGMKMSSAKLLENQGRSGLRSVADPTIQKGSRLPFWVCPVGFFRFAQATSSITNPGFSSHRIRKKGSLATSSSGCPVGFEPTTFRTTI